MNRFDEDPHFREALLRSAGVRVALEDRVAAVADVASELAPDDPDTTSNDLSSSIVGDVDMTARGWAGRVAALNFKAPWYEVGSARTEPRPFLRPAAEQEVGPIEAGED